MFGVQLANVCALTQLSAEVKALVISTCVVGVDKRSGPVQHPHPIPVYLVLLIPLMLCGGRFPGIPLRACIPVLFDSCL